MSFGSPERPPRIPETPPLRKEPEVKKALIDEEERRRRVQMNRQKSRLRLPDLQDSAALAGLSNRL